MTKQTSEVQSLWNKSFKSGALGHSAENKDTKLWSLCLQLRLGFNAELNGCPYYVKVFVVFGGAGALVPLGFSFESNYYGKKEVDVEISTQICVCVYDLGIITFEQEIPSRTACTKSPYAASQV